MKIVILIPYFGTWPPWIDYFLASCRYNPELEFLLMSDAGKPDRCPPNVRYRQFSLAEFNEIADSALGIPVKVSHPYKLCDFRPAFGMIFSHTLEDADFWGYSDLDLVFGKITRFLTPDIFDHYDVISVRREYLAGHFALFRNSDHVNKLYSSSPVYRRVFTDADRHYAFDERSNAYGRRLVLHKRRGRGNRDRPGTGIHPGYEANIRLRRYRAIEHTLNRIKYRMGIRRPEAPADMNSVVRQAGEKGEIRVFRENMVRSDIWYLKNRMGDWKIEWRDGKLFALPGEDELLHFHFIGSKRNREFRVEPIQSEQGFIISAGGIGPVQ